jgi:hypothetical protein
MFFIQILRKLYFTELFEAGDPIIGNNVFGCQYPCHNSSSVSKMLFPNLY